MDEAQTSRATTCALRAIDVLVKKHSGYSTFIELVAAGAAGYHRPTIACRTNSRTPAAERVLAAERLVIADAYDEALKAVGSTRLPIVRTFA